MIRQIGPEEFPFLLPGARDFFREKALLGTLNEAHFVKSLTGHHETGIGFVLAAGLPTFRGAIAGVVVPDFATGDATCLELFWYVRPEERGVGLKLLISFEQEAKRRGAKRIVMMHLVDERMNDLVKVYERRGYGLREQMYSKEL